LTIYQANESGKETQNSMAKCIRCAGAAKSKDPVNGFSYCGVPCQRKHYLIGDGLCRNEDDSDTFTLEPFSEMDPRDIIAINDFCYHLPSLYTWVFRGPGKEHGRAPHTRARFGPAELEQLQSTAKERYPLNVRVTYINLPPRPNTQVVTTSLCSMDDFIAKVLNEHVFPGRNLTTHREFAIAIANPVTNVTFVLRNGQRALLIALLRQTVTKGATLDPREVESIAVYRPERVIDRANLLYEISYYLGSVREMVIPPEIEELEFRLDADMSEEDGRNHDKFRFAHPATIVREQHDAVRGPAPQDPALREVNISINSWAGQAYGTFPIYVPIESRLQDLIPYIQRETEGIRQPRGPLRFIHAGVLWPNSKPLSEFRAGPITLYMAGSNAPE
jgi:hypothetical protein